MSVDIVKKPEGKFALNKKSGVIEYHWSRRESWHYRSIGLSFFGAVGLGILAGFFEAYWAIPLVAGWGAFAILYGEWYKEKVSNNAILYYQGLQSLEREARYQSIIRKAKENRNDSLHH